MSQQNLQNHARYVPLFHFVTFGLVMLNLVRAVRAALPLSYASFLDVGVALALLLMCWFLRAVPLTVQDRVIRLEERLRMREVLPADLHARIGELTREQFVGLRFASDGELADLVRRVLAGELKDTTAIKKAVTQWRGDYLRA